MPICAWKASSEHRLVATAPSILGWRGLRRLAIAISLVGCGTGSSIEAARAAGLHRLAGSVCRKPRLILNALRRQGGGEDSAWHEDIEGDTSLANLSIQIDSAESAGLLIDERVLIRELARQNLHPSLVSFDLAPLPPASPFPTIGWITVLYDSVRYVAPHERAGQDTAATLTVVLRVAYLHDGDEWNIWSPAIKLEVVGAGSKYARALRNVGIAESPACSSANK